MRSADVILPYIQEYVRKYSWTPSGTVLILPAALGNDAGLLGAIPLLTDMYASANATAGSNSLHARTL